jgi:hypothetical protein
LQNKPQALAGIKARPEIERGQVKGGAAQTIFLSEPEGPSAPAQNHRSTAALLLDRDHDVLRCSPCENILHGRVPNVRRAVRQVGRDVEEVAWSDIDPLLIVQAK